MNIANRLTNAVVAAVFGAVAAALVGAVLKRVWTASTGEQPPDPLDPETPLRRAAMWTALSGVGVAIAQLVSARLARRYVSNQPAQSTQ